MLFVLLVTKAWINKLQRIVESTLAKPKKGSKNSTRLQNAMATHSLTFNPWQPHSSRLVSGQQETLNQKGEAKKDQVALSYNRPWWAFIIRCPVGSLYLPNELSENNLGKYPHAEVKMVLEKSFP